MRPAAIMQIPKTVGGGWDTGGDVKIKSIKVKLTRLTEAMFEREFRDGIGTRVKKSK